VFKSRLLRKLYVSEGEEVAGGWNRLYSEEMTDLHSEEITDLYRLLICTVRRLLIYRDY